VWVSAADGIPELTLYVGYDAQGGANAGHTIYDEAGTKYALHQVRIAVLPPPPRVQGELTTPGDGAQV